MKQGSTVLIFDLDGTLYPFNDDYQKACTEAVNKSGGLLSGIFNAMDDYHTIDAVHNFARTHGLHSSLRGLPKKQAQRLDQALRKLKPDFLKPDQKLIDVLQEAKAAGAELLLLSHNSQAWADKALKKLGLDKIFPPEVRFTPEDNLGRKTQEQTYHNLKSAAHIPPNSSIHLFDDTNKHKPPAERAGIKFHAVSGATGVTPEQIKAATNPANQANQDHTFGSPTDP